MCRYAESRVAINYTCKNDERHNLTVNISTVIFNTKKCFMTGHYDNAYKDLSYNDFIYNII